MQLILSISHLKKMIAFALENPEIECCGYLIGTIKEESNCVKKVLPMTNIHPNPKEHFSFDSKEQLEVFKGLQGLEIVGIYHSHPKSPPKMSKEDLSYVFFSKQSNFILSLENGISFASYRVSANKPKKERVQIIEIFEV